MDEENKWPCSMISLFVMLLILTGGAPYERLLEVLEVIAKFE